METNMKAYISFIIAMLIFGSIGVFVEGIPLKSSEIVSARTIFGSLFLGGVLLIRKKKIDWSILKKHIFILIATGIVMGLNWLFLFVAYHYTTVSVATLIYYLAPVIVLILSPFFFHERLTKSKVVGICISLLGLILVNGTISGGIQPGKGLVFGFLSAIFYAGLMLLNKKITEVPPIEKTLVQLLSAGIVMTIYSILTREGNPVSLTKENIVSLVLIGVVHTGIAYLLYISSIQKLSGQTVALCSYLDPMAALVFSAICLQERLTVVQICGAILILSGSAFGEIYGRTNTKK